MISIRRKIIWIRYEAQFFEMKIVYLTWIICCVVRDETSNSCQRQYNQQKKHSLNECDEASAQPTESEIKTKQYVSFYILEIIFLACVRILAQIDMQICFDRSFHWNYSTLLGHGLLDSSVIN